MENTEIMEIENNEVLEGEIVEDEKSLSTAGAMLIGAAATAATVAVVKLGKKVIAKVKAHKAATTENDITVELKTEDDEADVK